MFLKATVVICLGVVTLSLTSLAKPVQDDSEGVRAKLSQDDNGLARILQDDEKLAKMLQYDDGLARILQDDDGLAKMLQDDDGLARILQNDENGVLAKAFQGDEGEDEDRNAIVLFLYYDKGMRKVSLTVQHICLFLKHASIDARSH